MQFSSSSCFRVIGNSNVWHFKPFHWSDRKDCANFSNSAAAQILAWMALKYRMLRGVLINAVADAARPSFSVEKT